MELFVVVVVPAVFVLPLPLSSFFSLVFVLVWFRFRAILSPFFFYICRLLVVVLPVLLPSCGFVWRGLRPRYMYKKRFYVTFRGTTYYISWQHYNHHGTMAFTEVAKLTFKKRNDRGVITICQIHKYLFVFYHCSRSSFGKPE